MIDSILESTNTLYICKKCEEFKSCLLPDIENHMILAHGMTVSQEFHHFYEEQKIDLKVDTFKTMSYGCRYLFMTSSCNSCDTVTNNFNELISHMYNHFTHRFFICIFCKSFGGQLEFLLMHYRKEHPEYYSRINSKTEEFKYRKPLELINEFHKNRLIFVNGFVMTFREASNTKYNPSKRILAAFNEKSLKLLKEFKKTNSFSIKFLNFNDELVDPEVEIMESNKILLKDDIIWQKMIEEEEISEKLKEAEELKRKKSSEETKKKREIEKPLLGIDYDKISVFDSEISELIPFKLFKTNVNLEPNILLHRCSLNQKIVDNTDDESSDELVIDENPVETEIDENNEKTENLEQINQDPNGNCSKNSPNSNPSKSKESDDDEEVVLIVDSSMGSSVLRDMLLDPNLPEILKKDDEDVLIVEDSE